MVVPSGTSAALESSIFVGEGRGLDHSNRLLKARILAIGNILKALKMEFYGFLSYFGACFFAVLKPFFLTFCDSAEHCGSSNFAHLPELTQKHP